MQDTRNITLISLSRLISELGSAAIRFALSLFILDITGSPLMSGFVFAFTYIPGILINTFAGVHIDRSDKKKILVAAEFLCGIATLLFMGIFIFVANNITLIICYVVILYTFQAIFNLALNASIPEIVSKERVMTVNSNIQSISALINIFGIILGATLYTLLGLNMLLLLDGISFIIASILNIFLVFVNKPNREEIQEKSYFESMKEVYQYIKARKEIKLLLGIFVTINFLVTPLISIVLLYIIRDELKMSGYEMAFIEAGLGVGSIVGAVLISIKKVGKFVTNKIFIMIQLMALMILLWIFPAFLSIESKVVMTSIYVVIITLLGLFNVMANIPMISYVQIYIPENIRASIFGVVTTVTTTSVPIGLLIFGAVMEMANWIYLVSVSGTILIVMGYFAHRSNALREFFSVELEPEKELKPVREEVSKSERKVVESNT
ncbi:MFS transporter [Paenibacillus albidus]|uniref:MFS transporter n=1 Tax=Paenibacillus albidus TaxID=2041023 RepID=A0A917D5J9_9BACL|nr:MFS transporter [Paenibacillus albidus]GGG11629.1 MFS transporter [Paenibacillus albidus]